MQQNDRISPAPISADACGGKTSTPTFALVIGISKYSCGERYGNLRSAVPDADDFAEFLEKTLHVPASNITNLRDEDATRVNIVKAFKALQKNDLVKKEEAATIVYYAGHGATNKIPEGWGQWDLSRKLLEVLCPYDIGDSSSDRTVICGIPDYTIAALLNHISRNRGNNITVILDCCHSASMTRGSAIECEDFTPRLIYDPPDIPSDCDTEIIRENVDVVVGTPTEQLARGARALLEEAGQNRESHILLAACGRDELAWESKKLSRGLFTKSLLDLLRDSDVPELTYSSVMHRLKKIGPIKYKEENEVKIAHQTPHCEGAHVNRRLFDKSNPGASRSLIAGQNIDNKITLSIGDAQGVNKHAKFGVFKTDIESEANKQLGILSVSKVDLFKSELSFTEERARFEVPQVFYAKQVVAGVEKKYRVFLNTGTSLTGTITADSVEPFGAELVEIKEEADLVISLEDENFVFDRQDHEINQHLGQRIPSTTKDEYCVLDVIRSASRFFYHLRRTGADFQTGIKMELRELTHTTGLNEDGEYDLMWLPVGPNLFDKSNRGRVVVKQGLRYGMAIHNNTAKSLYPYLFYFDPNELAIQDWYLGPSARLMECADPPLMADGKLFIGYGNAGAAMWEFVLEENVNKDFGFFKVFVTTSSSDFSSIIQGSPFKPKTFRSGNEGTRDDGDVECWGSRVYPILQTRAEVPRPKTR